MSLDAEDQQLPIWGADDRRDQSGMALERAVTDIPVCFSCRQELEFYWHLFYESLFYYAPLCREDDCRAMDLERHNF